MVHSVINVWSMKKMTEQKTTIKLVTIFSLIAIVGISVSVLGNVYIDKKIFKTENFSEFIQKLDIDYVSNMTNEILIENPSYDGLLEGSQVIDVVHAQEEDRRSVSLSELFEKSEKGVVQISVSGPLEFSPSFSTRVGSGFVYDTEGHIITNNHVIENADKIVVTLVDGTSYNAEKIGSDPSTDLAVIKIDASSDRLYPLGIGNSSLVKVGQSVAAIGNPYGLSGTMTAGIISQIGRLLPAQDGTGFSIPDVIQTDAAINPGNSGGPLLDMYGEVIGINTAIFSRIGEFTGVGFAIPSNTVTKMVPGLIEHGEYKHPWIGISGKDIGPDLAEILEKKEAKGFLVMTVVQDSPADDAGLVGSSTSKIVHGVEHIVGGDVIVSVDGNEVRKIEDILIHLQREKSVGDELVLGIIRDGKSIDVTIVLGERP